MAKKYYQMSVEEVVQHFKTDCDNGLSEEIVNERRLEAGYNEFVKTRHTSLFHKFISQFKSFMIIVLLIAAAVSGVTGYMNGEGITDALIILSILVVNAIIGVFQEAKAEKSLDALEKLSAPHCKVIRNGERKVMESRELVPGDIVDIETGDHVPADLRLTEAVNLKIQEAALTGESVPVEKSVAVIDGEVGIGDRLNMAYGSCSVTYGRGRGVVVSIGQNTEVGKIASMIQSVPEIRTPMQNRLDQLGKILAVISLVVCVGIFIVGLCYGRGLLEMFMTAVSLAVAAIPEGLPAVSTVVLALGVQRLAKQNAIVRNLPSVETLGSTTVICSDKTGTLTQNRMTVKKVYACGKLQETGADDEAVMKLIEVSVLANDASIFREYDRVSTVGDPTETALVDMGLKSGVDKDALQEKMPRVAEVPFDSERKLMSTVHKCPDGKYLVAVKGGLDEMLKCCTSIYYDGEIRAIEGEDVVNIHDANVEMASDALRVLAAAYRYVDEMPDEVTADNLEKDLVFVGMTGMIDPPREEVKYAVHQCMNAGIKPVMITGDHKITASAIARSLDIMKEGDMVLTGAEVETMTEEELIRAAGSTSVFARVAPEHKVRIVKAYQSLGNVVAMTGDGVNDAPALKLSNIGVAMGITGTDVSKEAADVVLADDNFATIVSAVQEGRRIYDNLIKSIQFMISTNLGEIVLILTAVVCNVGMPLLPIQLLFINLVGDSLPALALSVDHAAKDIMNRKPADPGKGIFTREFTLRLVIQALIIGGVTIAAYMAGSRTSEPAARTMTFATMIFSQFTMIFSIRSGNKPFIHRFFSNRWLWMTIVFVIGLTLMVMLVPALQALFKLTDLAASQWYMVMGLSFGVLILSEIFKLVSTCSNSSAGKL